MAKCKIWAKKIYNMNFKLDKIFVEMQNKNDNTNYCIYFGLIWLQCSEEARNV